MLLRHKFVTLSALTLISLTGVSAASAQVITPRLENRRIIPFELPSPSSSYLGVQTENVTKDNANKYNLNEPRGVAIVKVVENSPAANAGLRDTDVIVRFEGEEVKSTAKLLRLIEEVAPDQKARITILRGDNEQEITVTMGKRQSPAQGFGTIPPGEWRSMENMPTMPQLPDDFKGFEPRSLPDTDINSGFLFRNSSGRRLGMSVTPLTKQLADYFGATSGQGLLVREVGETSAAAKAGLKAGDVILEVDGEAVARLDDLTRLINRKNEGDVTLTVLRNKQRLTLRATPTGRKEAAIPAPASGNTKFKI